MRYNAIKSFLPTIGLALGLAGCATPNLKTYVTDHTPAEVKRLQRYDVAQKWKDNRASMKLVEPTAVTIVDDGVERKVARTKEVFPWSKYNMDLGDQSLVYRVIAGNLNLSTVRSSYVENGNSREQTCEVRGTVSPAKWGLNKKLGEQVTEILQRVDTDRDYHISLTEARKAEADLCKQVEKPATLEDGLSPDY